MTVDTVTQRTFLPARIQAVQLPSSPWKTHLPIHGISQCFPHRVRVLQGPSSPAPIPRPFILPGLPWFCACLLTRCKSLLHNSPSTCLSVYHQHELGDLKVSLQAYLFSCKTRPQVSLKFTPEDQNAACTYHWSQKSHF